MSDLKMDLMPHQQEAVDMLAKRSRVLISFPTGCGKTLAGIAWAVRRKSRLTLIGCPSVLITQWVEEIRRARPKDKVVALRASGLSKEWDAVHTSDPNWVVVSLDALKSSKWEDREMWRIQPHAMIIDEAHQLRGFTTQRTRSWKRLIDARARDSETFGLALLTATPVVKGPLDLASLMAVLGIADYGRLCREQVAWDRTLVPVRGGGKREVSIPSGWKDPEFPARALKGISISRRKEELLKDLPELARRVCLVPLREATLERELTMIYRERRGVDVMTAVEAAMGLLSSPKVTEAIEAAGVAVVNDVMRVAGLAKAAHIAEMVEASIGSQKFIIFCKHREVVYRISSHLRTSHWTLTGDQPAPERAEYAREFTAAEGPQVLVATYAAAGVGLNLEAGSTAILAELDYSPAVEAQAIGRIHRKGQSRECVAIRMLCNVGGSAGAFEVRVLDAHIRKSGHAKVAEEAMG